MEDTYQNNKNTVQNCKSRSNIYSMWVKIELINLKISWEDILPVFKSWLMYDCSELSPY